MLLERMIGFVAPHICLHCGQEGSLLCAQCQKTHLTALPAVCYKCRQPAPHGLTCEVCRASSAIRSVQVVTSYDGLPKDLVYRLKFARAQAAAKTIADIMMGHCQLPDPNVLVVHIPTATSRIRQRGYDQAALIAHYLGRKLGLTARKALYRHGQTRQVGAGREARRRQLKNSFFVPSPRAVKGQHILLVDDVITTGATIEEAAKT